MLDLCSIKLFPLKNDFLYLIGTFYLSSNLNYSASDSKKIKKKKTFATSLPLKYEISFV